MDDLLALAQRVGFLEAEVDKWDEVKKRFGMEKLRSHLAETGVKITDEIEADIEKFCLGELSLDELSKHFVGKLN